jgi:hypothetical protein
MPGCQNTLPEVLISGQEIAILVENRKSHSVRMRLKDLIPSPQHVTVHIIRNAMLSPK